MGQFLKLKKIILIPGMVLAGLTAAGPVLADGFTLSPGRKAYDHQNYEQAKELFQKKLQKNPSDADDAYALGNSLYRQQEYQDAVDAYQKALGLKSGDEDAKHNLQLAQEKLKSQPKNKKEKDEKKNAQNKKNNPSSSSSKSARNPSSDSSNTAQKQSSPGTQPKPGDSQKASGSSPKNSENKTGSNPSASAPTEDQRRQAQAKKELGLSDGQVRDLLEKMQKQEHQTQQYFSLNPKKDQQDNDPMWNLIPKQQRELMQQLMGNKSQGSKNEPEEDW